MQSLISIEKIRHCKKMIWCRASVSCNSATKARLL